MPFAVFVYLNVIIGLLVEDVNIWLSIGVAALAAAAALWLYQETRA